MEKPHLEWNEWRHKSKIIDTYGIGLVNYRDYLYSYIILDILLSCFALVPIAAHVAYGDAAYQDSSSDGQSANSTTYISPAEQVVYSIVTASYTTSSIPFVYAYMVVHLICIVLHPIVYQAYLQKNRVSENIELEDRWEDEFHLREPEIWKPSQLYTARIKVSKDQGSDPGDLIIHDPVAEAHRRWCRKWTRNGISILLFCLVLVAYGVCLWLLQTYLYSTYLNLNTQAASTFPTHIWISVILAVVQASTDLVWMIVAELLRFVEIHESQDAVEKWQCVRLFLLRIFSINMFYAIRTFILQSQDACSAGLLGAQHILIVASYIFGDMVADYAWPWLYRSFRRRQGNYIRDYESWYEFMLSEQYATIAYRHILLSCGASFIPGLSIIALLGNYMQLKSDQYRLSCLCKISHRLYSSYHRFLQFLGLVTVLCYLLSFPKGVLFLFIEPQSFFTCDMLNTY